MAAASAVAMLLSGLALALLIALVCLFSGKVALADDASSADAPEAKAGSAQTALPSDLLQHVVTEVTGTVPDSRLNNLVVDGQFATCADFVALSRASDRYASRVEEDFQYPDMPSGCEVISLGIALRACGFAVQAAQIADEHLIIDGEPRGYLASPYDYDGGGLPSGIAKAANSYLQTQQTQLRAHDLTGTDFATLESLVEAGYPVLIWVTDSLVEPYLESDLDDEAFWYWPEHCMVLYGVDGDTVLLSDPIEGYRAEEAELVAGIYEACGSHALAVF